MNSNRKLFVRIVPAFAALLMISLAGCKALEGGGRNPAPIPGAQNGYLAAKVVAFRSAMEFMPEEAKRYGEQSYVASGVSDTDPAHAKVIMAALGDMQPPVMPASNLYTRGENSKWLDGRPAIAWTSKVARLTPDQHVIVQVGWMHSNLVYEFYEYETRYSPKSDSWDVVDFTVLGNGRG